MGGAAAGGARRRAGPGRSEPLASSQGGLGGSAAPAVPPRCLPAPCRAASSPAGAARGEPPTWGTRGTAGRPLGPRAPLPDPSAACWRTGGAPWCSRCAPGFNGGCGGCGGSSLAHGALAGCAGRENDGEDAQGVRPAPLKVHFGQVGRYTRRYRRARAADLPQAIVAPGGVGGSKVQPSQAAAGCRSPSPIKPPSRRPGKSPTPSAPLRPCFGRPSLPNAPWTRLVVLTAAGERPCLQHASHPPPCAPAQSPSARLHVQRTSEGVCKAATRASKTGSPCIATVALPPPGWKLARGHRLDQAAPHPSAWSAGHGANHVGTVRWIPPSPCTAP